MHALQCRHCRNINYEHPDAFLCNECGHCRFARVECTVSAAAVGSYPALGEGSPLDEAAALSVLQEAADAAHDRKVELQAVTR